MIAYIDTVSTAAPTHGGAEPWRAHCIRVAVALEDDRKIVGVHLRLVTPLPGVVVDPQWTTRYGVPGMPWEDAPAEGWPASEVAGDLRLLLPGAVCVCQNSPFHRDVLVGLFVDAVVDGPEVGGHFCTQREARPIVGALTVAGKPKAPTLGESYRYFTGKTLPLIATLGWREAALVQLNALRAVHWGLLGLGVPTDPITETQEPPT